MTDESNISVSSLASINSPTTTEIESRSVSSQRSSPVNLPLDEPIFNLDADCHRKSSDDVDHHGNPISGISKSKKSSSTSKRIHKFLDCDTETDDNACSSIKVDQIAALPNRKSTSIGGTASSSASLAQQHNLNLLENLQKNVSELNKQMLMLESAYTYGKSDYTKLIICCHELLDRDIDDPKFIDLDLSSSSLDYLQFNVSKRNGNNTTIKINTEKTIRYFEDVNKCLNFLQVEMGSKGHTEEEIIGVEFVFEVVR